MRKTVLLIDDDDDIHSHLRILLTTAGYNFISATSGDDGLQKILSNDPDLIILDYLMPDRNGADVFDLIKKSEKFEAHRNTPVIMLTAANQSSQKVRLLLEYGLNAYLEKPFGNKELLNVITNTIITNDINTRNALLRKATEHSKNFLESLVESCPVAIVTFALNGVITFANKATEDILGYRSSELVGDSIHELLGTHASDLIKKFGEEIIPLGGLTAAIHVKCQSGRVIPMGVTLSYLKNQLDEVHGLLLVAQDLSLQKQLESELLEKERLAAIAESAATINHEINNPLTPILGNIQLIRKEDDLLSDDHKRKLEIIETNVRKISSIIQKFNQISNPESKPYYGETSILKI